MTPYQLRKRRVSRDDDSTKHKRAKNGNGNGDDDDEDEVWETDDDDEALTSETLGSKDTDEDDDEDEDEDYEDAKELLLNLLGGGGGEDAEDALGIETGEDKECDSDDERVFMPAFAEPKHALPQPPPPSPSPDITQQYCELSRRRAQLEAQLAHDMFISPEQRIEITNEYSACEKDIRDLVKTARYENTKKYHTMVHSASNPMNEMEYFKTKLSNEEQLQVMKDMEQINTHLCIEKPYRLLLLQTNIPPRFKAMAMQKLNMLKTMSTSNSEYYKLKNWVDAFMRIPFGLYRSLSVNLTDGIDVCNDFMVNAKSTLDNCVYGMNDAKLQIMQMLGQWIANPSSMGSAIAIHGPPGTGKTSIVKDGISKILGRDFAFIALGGSGDSSFLEGHSYTYEGSSWGKISQILMESKSMNPVIYFDELDKVSDTARGQEIIGVLTHLTDSSQNSQFHDKYFSEVDFDLSKCLFIFSYNNESLVNPVLKDRMYRIQTNGYDTKDKMVIARKYMIPKICEQVNMSISDIVIPDDVLQYMISSQHLTKQEQGVRNLKRCLELIYTKLNLFRIVKPDSDVLKQFIDMKVSFPYTVTKKDLDILIRKDEPVNLTLLSMYI
jgi:ATP-dependent Lon protease